MSKEKRFVSLFRSSDRDAGALFATASSSASSSEDKLTRDAPAPSRRKVFKGAITDPFPIYSSRSDDYELGPEPIGFGATSTVYAARFKPLDIRCAVKVIDVDRLSVSNIDRLRREASIMSLSKHPNVLRVRGEWLSGTHLYVAARLMAAGSLKDIMDWSHPDGFDEVTIATILKQVLEGLLYFHENGWLHRDLKAANVLVDEDGTVLLADFGVSSVLVAESRSATRESLPTRKSFVGSPCWMAPEIINATGNGGSGYDAKVDIWSFGITALELSTGHAPHAYIPAVKAMHKTVHEAAPTVKEDGPVQFTKAFKDMVDSCLRKDPSKRPTAHKLLSHAFFKQAKRPSYLVASILSGLPPLEARQSRRRAATDGLQSMDGSWDFGTVNSASSLRPSGDPSNDPFATFSGVHSTITPLQSPVRSRQFAELPATETPSTSAIKAHGRSVSFSVHEEVPTTTAAAAAAAAAAKSVPLSPASVQEDAALADDSTSTKERAKTILGRFGFR